MNRVVKQTTPSMRLLYVPTGVILAVGGRLKDIKGTWPVNPCLDPHHADTMLEHVTPASSGILNDLPTHGKAPEYLKKSEHSGFVWMARLAAAPPRMQH